MSHRNGKVSQSDADSGTYVKNEIDVKLDRITDLWNKLERNLLKEQPPRRIICMFDEVEGETDEGEHIYGRRYLGVQRHGGKWRVCYADATNNHDDEGLPWKPVVECDVETRMLATKGIEQLKSAVRDTGTDFIPALNKAISALEDSITNDDEE